MISNSVAPPRIVDAGTTLSGWCSARLPESWHNLAMSDARVFLGWDQPCLVTAARWLRQRYQGRDLCDMSGVVIVLPGARAGRRLLELLTEAAGVFIPPRIITLGSLPELLYDSDRPIASPLSCLLTRAHALRCADRATLERIVPQPPDDGDLIGWLALARDLGKLDDELAAQSLNISHVIAQCEKQIDFDDSPRWQAIASLQQAYEKTLERNERQDVNMARRAAIDGDRCRTDCDIVLLAVTDLPGVMRQMLSQVRDRVTCLVHAPEDERNAFDDWGCVMPQAWIEREIAIDDDAIHIVSRPRDQAMALLDLIGAPGDPTSNRTLAGRYRADEITIGLGDQTLAGPVERTLALSHLPTHWAGGKPLTQSRPGLLLASIRQFAHQHRLSDFASLLRHPDIEHYLIAVADAAAPPAQLTIEHWLTLLDRYISEHLSSGAIGHWLGDADDALALRQVYETVFALLPKEAQMRRPLPSWSQPIADLLQTVYAQASLDPQQADDAQLIAALEAIADALREQAALDPHDPTTPIVSFADALALTLSLLTAQATPTAAPSAGSAIELLGWLELMLDDAPALLITGFNEHHIPESTTADAFLPDHLRKSLGLTDNIRRYARDAAALEAMTHSKKFLALIAGRRGADDEPLAPSRLLLTGDADTLARRIIRFYPKDESHDAAPPHALFALAGTSRFLIPRPQPPAKLIERMNVTWFRDYLACPYRFYLKHIERLRALDDDVVELDGMSFGNTVHEVLSRFAKSEQRELKQASHIASALKDHLHEVAAQRLGDEPPVAARLQLIQIEQRLERFALWQSQQMADGWRIAHDYVECSAQAIFEVEDGQVTVHGRIDRIDRHESDGRYRIIDYKTGDAGDTPEKTHRKGPKDAKDWIDLQLPMYHHLARAMNLMGEIELGYVLLPKKLEAIGFSQALWSLEEIEDGIARARRIIDSVRAGIFWPPGQPVQYADEFSAICMDACESRADLIAQITRQMEGK